MVAQVRPARIHLAHIDGLRAFAALWVVLGHSFRASWWRSPSGALQMPHGFIAILFDWVTNAHYAVAIFIVISGFCLMLPVARTNRFQLGTFFFRRARRILPPYYAAIGFTLLLIWLVIGKNTGTQWDGSLPVTLKSILVHLLLLQDFSGRDVATISGILWSIAIEWQLYWLFPVLQWSLRRVGAIPIVLIVVASNMVLFRLLQATPLGQIGYYGDWGFTPQFIGLFTIGMAGALVAFGPQRHWAWLREQLPWGWLSGCLVICWVVFYLTHVNAPYTSWQEALLDLPAAFTVVVLLIGGMHAQAIQTILGWRPLAFIGLFSYSLYLTHFPLVHLFWFWVLQPLHLSGTVAFAGYILFGVPIFLAFAYGFYWVCERPFLNHTPVIKTQTAAELAESVDGLEAVLPETLKRPVITLP